MTPRPTCLGCGKFLAKRTTWQWFSKPVTEDEARRSTNKQIIRLIREFRNPELVRSMSTWDGESYGIDGQGNFCTNRCGFDYGTAVANRVKRACKSVRGDPP